MHCGDRRFRSPIGCRQPWVESYSRIGQTTRGISRETRTKVDRVEIQKHEVDTKEKGNSRSGHVLALFLPPPALRFPPRLVFALLRFALHGSQYQVPWGGVVRPRHGRWN